MPRRPAPVTGPHEAVPRPVATRQPGSGESAVAPRVPLSPALPRGRAYPLRSCDDLTNTGRRIARAHRRARYDRRLAAAPSGAEVRYLPCHPGPNRPGSGRPVPGSAVPRDRGDGPAGRGRRGGERPGARRSRGHRTGADAVVRVFERVYEVGPVFRAEPHDTARHLAQYVSLDAELGFITDHLDVMSVCRDAIAGMVDLVGERVAPAMRLLGAALPSVPAQIPHIHFADAMELISSATGEDKRHEPDLAPAHERWLCEWAQRKHGSE